MFAPKTARLLTFPRSGGGMRAALLPHLKRHRLPEQLIETLIREAALFQASGIDRALAHVLKARMRFKPLDLSRATRIFLIGPCGAGVSSVAAKLHRQASATGREIHIESQSFHPRNIRAQTAFGCVGERPEVETIGVISALADAEETCEIITAFHLDRLIVTGLDMARRLGALTAAITQGAGLAHVTRSPDESAPLEMLTPAELAFMLLR